ncbi:MAG TPA: hypothetical protein VN541_07710 [Tepidisphaeraceae bacterium]|nr:hypothetical protein [Tepidisphaeraceae bacterium]
MDGYVVLGAAAVITIWMILTLLGGERQRQIQFQEAEAAARAAAEPQPSPTSPTSPRK